MRSRVGGFIGPPRRPLSYAASGVWTLGEGHSSRTENQWPRNYLDFTSYSEYADATQNGSATLYAAVTYSFGYNQTTYEQFAPSYVWQKSTNGGSTWSVVAGETSSSLSLAGLTSANNGNLYRFEATYGLRQKISIPIAIRYETSFAFTWYENGDVSGGIGDDVYIYGYVNSITGAAYGSTYSPSDLQWQQSTNGGSTWTDMAGESNYYIAINVQAGMNGRKYRVRSRVSAAHAWYASPVITLTITT